ncbi:rCG58370 [Rattus norvegicus]|uniref:RCG58370 n=1 Tax=Rattus norvegicus TaxID=10116 RepID=A6J488_RAT|nr:rCG58370 [Rattus norvegicus]
MLLGNMGYHLKLSQTFRDAFAKDRHLRVTDHGQLKT